MFRKDITMVIIPLEINFIWDEGPESTTVIIVSKTDMTVTDAIGIIKAAHDTLCRQQSNDEESLYGTLGRDAETLMNFICNEYHPDWSWYPVTDAIDLN